MERNEVIQTLRSSRRQGAVNEIGRQGEPSEAFVAGVPESEIAARSQRHRGALYLADGAIRDRVVRLRQGRARLRKCKARKSEGHEGGDSKAAAERLSCNHHQTPFCARNGHDRLIFNISRISENSVNLQTIYS